MDYVEKASKGRSSHSTVHLTGHDWAGFYNQEVTVHKVNPQHFDLGAVIWIQNKYEYRICWHEHHKHES